MPSIKQRVLTSVYSLLLLFSLTGCIANFPMFPQSYDLDETVIEKDDGWAQGYIAVIDVSGMIMNHREQGFLAKGENPVDFLRERLKEAEKDSFVKGVILRVNTPGGGVTASDLMYDEIQNYRKKTQKPVVVLMMDMATSGGYYIACAGDHIIAHESTITGSIGVISQFISVKGLMDKIGVKSNTITSGANKAAGSPLDEMNDSQRAIFQEMVTQLYGRFTSIVKANRENLDKEKWDEYTDGRVLTSKQALSYGLIDQIGTMHDAWSAAKQLAGVERAHLVYYHRPGDIPATFYSQAQMSTPQKVPGAGSGIDGLQVNLMQLNLSGGLGMNSMGGFYYLWMPE